MWPADWAKVTKYNRQNKYRDILIIIGDNGFMAPLINRKMDYTQ
jgi:hypothetical protein